LEPKELTDWMERHGVGEMLRSWASNMLLARRRYGALENLAVDGTATIKIVLGEGQMKISKAKTYESDVSNLKGKLKDAEAELKETKKTISTYEAEIESLKKETSEETVATEETQEIETAKRGSIRKARRPTV
jgi:seryl-tRNA synthetase